MENKFTAKARLPRCEGGRERAKSFLRSSRNNYPRNFSVVEVVSALRSRGARFGSRPPIAFTASSSSGPRSSRRREARRRESQRRRSSASRVLLGVRADRRDRWERRRRERSRAVHHPDGRKTPRSITRISSFAGRVTEAAVLRKGHVVAERVELRPADHACDVFRRSYESGAATEGVRKTASRGSRRFTLSRKRTCQLASSTRSLPTRARHVPAREDERASLAASNAGHRSTEGCTSRCR